MNPETPIIPGPWTLGTSETESRFKEPSELKYELLL